MAVKAEILLVDDDRDFRDALRIILENHGYTVRTAGNRNEALEALNVKKPDLIILDVMMATDTEGFDLAYQLKHKPEYRNVPIVMVTGFTLKMAEIGPERWQHILGEDWPAAKMFEKPIDPDELLAAVQALLKEAHKA